MDLKYGKKITYEGYYDGKLKSTKVEYSIPMIIQDKSQVMAEMLNVLELIRKKETNKVSIIIEADPKTHYLRLLTKNYIVEL